MKSKLYLIVAIFLSMILTACGGGSNDQMFTTKQVQEAAAAAARAAKVDEASKADAKLDASRAELKKLAVDTARQGGFSAVANCNVLPAGFANTNAVKNFPSNAPAQYRASCVREVAVMNAERKANANRAIAKAKQAERNKAVRTTKVGHH